MSRAYIFKYQRGHEYYGEEMDVEILASGDTISIGVSSSGEGASVDLSREHAATLRDALTAWLDGAPVLLEAPIPEPPDPVDVARKQPWRQFPISSKHPLVAVMLTNLKDEDGAVIIATGKDGEQLEAYQLRFSSKVSDTMLCKFGMAYVSAGPYWYKCSQPDIVVTGQFG